MPCLCVLSISIQHNTPNVDLYCFGCFNNDNKTMLPELAFYCVWMFPPFRMHSDFCVDNVPFWLSEGCKVENWSFIHSFIHWSWHEVLSKSSFSIVPPSEERADSEVARGKVTLTSIGFFALLGLPNWKSTWRFDNGGSFATKNCERQSRAAVVVSFLLLLLLLGSAVHRHTGHPA